MKKDQRLLDLENKINGLINKETINTKKEKKPYGIAFNVLLEFSSAVFISSLIGYYLDKFLETKFIFLIILLGLGLITGVINVKRYVDRLENKRK
jgi:ATP synthase protein I